jgi:hypothetical protein
MHARTIICRTLVMGIGLLLGGSAQALPHSKAVQSRGIEARGGSLHERFAVERYGSGGTKPKFPPPEERKKIKKRQRVLERYPQISVTGGLLLWSQDNTNLNDTFGRLEAGYGFQSGDEFSGSHFSSAIGVRFYFSRQLSLWTEYDPGGNGAARVLSVSGLYSVYRKHDRDFPCRELHRGTYRI